MKRLWIFDIDGTLANVHHRWHHINGVGKKDWDAFFANQHLDEPYDAVLDVFHALMYRHLSRGGKFIILTARDERFREDTREWLNRHIEADEDCYELIMRPAGDRGNDDVMKVQIIKNWLAANPDYQVGAIFEDRYRIVNACRDEGWYVFDCNTTRSIF